MKKLLLVSTLHLLICTVGFPQQSYWQQQIAYRIDVHLNDSLHTLDGSATIQYTNNSSDTLHFIWMHLWANAFKNDRTAFSEQLLANGDTRFYFSDPSQKGYINQLDFRTDEKYTTVEDHPEHQDIVKLILPDPLLPGQQVSITTPFHIQLPYNFGEGGHAGQSYELQPWWYPQPAVYDAKGWHAMPWLAYGTPYMHPASYDITISLPANYALAASGEILDDHEQAWMQKRSGFSWQSTKSRIKLRNGSYKTIRNSAPPSARESKTLHIRLDKGDSFSWIADKRLVIAPDTILLSTGNTVRILHYYLPGEKEPADHNEIKQALHFYNDSIFAYPYPTLNIIGLKYNRAYTGGIQLGKYADISELLARMWMQQSLPANTGKHPWLTNGLAGWNHYRYRKKYTNETFRGQMRRAALASAIATRTDQPIDLPAAEYTASNYTLSTYTKATAWMRLLNDRMGENDFKKAISTYYDQWQLRQAYPENFRHITDSISKLNTDSLYRLLDTRGPLKPATGKKIKWVLGAKADSENKYHYIGVAPVIGYNRYDGLMAGAVIHNYQLPPSAFKFAVAPMYATAGKTFAGAARISYTRYASHFLQSWELGADLARFNYSRFTDIDGNITRLGYGKVSPWLQLNLKNRDARNTRESYLRVKYYYITEENFSFRYDSAAQKMEVSTIGSSRSFGQVKLVSSDSRVLYPWNWELQFEGASNFGRLTFTGNYFFNYPKGGGLDIRGFAGKFFYFGSEDYETSRYHLNMTGPNGREDYAYGNYFIGRSEFQGWMSQQITMRDGSFKVRTDLLGNKIGRTDNWLVAFNLNSSIHHKIPVKIFADLGTYGEAWVRESGQPRLLFDAGLQLSLLKNTVNVYVPLLYSNVYRDYFRMYTRFWQRVSFSIDIQSLHFKKLQSGFRHYGY